MAADDNCLTNKRELKCELLCYVQNHFGSCAKSSLMTVISGFYNDVEIVEAKSTLFDTAEQLKTDGYDVGNHRLIIR